MKRERSLEAILHKLPEDHAACRKPFNQHHRQFLDYVRDAGWVPSSKVPETPKTKQTLLTVGSNVGTPSLASNIGSPKLASKKFASHDDREETRVSRAKELIVGGYVKLTDRRALTDLKNGIWGRDRWRCAAIAAAFNTGISILHLQTGGTVRFLVTHTGPRGAMISVAGPVLGF